MLETFNLMWEHIGHDFKVLWQGEDEPEVIELSCSCGKRILIDPEDKKNTKYILV